MQRGEDQNGTVIQPASVNGNVSTYKVADIQSERVLSILYKEVSQSEEKTEEVKGEEKSDEEQKESDDTNGTLKPECTLSQTVDGTMITVKSPEGALEEGWTLDVEKVSAKSVKSAIEGAVEDADAIEEIKAFDITIYDKDGNAIQPDGSVQVSFSGTGIKGDAAEVYHVDDSQKKAEKVCDATTNSNVEFEAEHFSIYAVVGSNTVYANTKDKHMRYFEFVHNLGIHSWDIPALVVAVILVVMILVRRHNQKKRVEDFEEELDQKIQDLREELDKTPAQEV